MSQTSCPELLAPAGDLDCIRAAIENGADAVYFGLDAGFNARARATNISAEVLPDVMALLHRRGLKGYVTLNTLAFPAELPQVEQLVRRVASAGVDAVLVQDLGVARLVRAICPELSIHASTQMTLTSAECIRAAAELGVERVVLSRELSIKEIAKIHRQTTMPLEVFVHGALCVAYSGQCMTSESLGGRSANRGQCAQACRLPYELVCDGQDVDLGDQKYLLSPQDLAAYELIPELIAAGVCSFKIEGRLKTPEYVANITRYYRQAIDSALAGQPVAFTPRQVEEMELSFSRGFSPGWLRGDDHKRLVPALSSAKRGVLLGRVVSVRGLRVVIELVAGVKRGDGIVFEGDRAEQQEQGGRVYEVFDCGRSLTDEVSSGQVELAFAHGSLDFDRIGAGQKIWKTDDPQLTARLRKTFSGEHAQRRQPLDIAVVAATGQPLTLVATVAGGVSCQIQSEQPLELARKHPLTESTLREQFDRLGGTNYELRKLVAQIEGRPMAPLSVLGQLRHEMVRQLDASASQPPTRNLAAEPVLPGLSRTRSSRDPSVSAFSSATPAQDDTPTIHVLCRSLDQLRNVLAESVTSVMVDLQDIREYAAAVELAHAARAKILLAPPRIQKPDELGILRVLTRHGADGILARNLAGLEFYAKERIPFVADYSLNVTNQLTFDYIRSLGAERVTASYDSNRDQLLDLVAAVSPELLEVVVHQHMPMFHMEHCVFCAVLSPGTNKTNCGRPCDRHDVQLRDRVGMLHPLKADVGCRNTLFNAVPQSAAEVVPLLMKRGVRNFRIELLTDAPRSEIARLFELYRELLAGKISGKQVWIELNAANRVGVTRGTLEERRNPLAIL